MVVEASDAVVAGRAVRRARRPPHSASVAKTQDNASAAVLDAALAHVGKGDDGGREGGRARNDAGIGGGAEDEQGKADEGVVGEQVGEGDGDLCGEDGEHEQEREEGAAVVGAGHAEAAAPNAAAAGLRGVGGVAGGARSHGGGGGGGRWGRGGGRGTRRGGGMRGREGEPEKGAAEARRREE
ncbi:hypothetical protein FGB62_21g430 [Gracilaria domingensis]|nr:hypothetical protein FGB62_21g430 [Gracilaria domingensis]